MASLNLINQKFGKLTVINKTDKRSRSGCIIWECKCDCGTTIYVPTNKLTSGSTKSCGCTRKEKLIEYNRTHNANDLTNQKFGLLTAVRKTDKRTKYKCVIWHCICDCGNECDVSSHDLRSGNTKSCGCMRNKSYGEEKIKNILDINNIEYIREYTPKTLPFKGRYDFYLPKYNCCIEYDGIQHTVCGAGKWDSPEKIQKTKENDNIKNKWCIDNKVFLIRIPYTHEEKIQLEDLLPDTSKFLIS